jgi:hypothetical protein
MPKPEFEGRRKSPAPLNFTLSQGATDQLLRECRLAADSTDRRNGLAKSFGWRFVV